ncbi:MAG: hypothetical protein H6Q04_3444 [Acidobacteria bacterium]|nr:hypothetical protein [Acidobacteriota bacterium]
MACRGLVFGLGQPLTPTVWQKEGKFDDREEHLGSVL